ncbi:hypothetical protein BT69DRAFT_1323784 [Atractiella rhizophila]|nr:hypothetical protein BT69DRAFT_1323784 [Atractiella rhizophila]
MKTNALVAIAVVGGFWGRGSKLHNCASTNCQAFLAELNGNSDLKTCLKPYTSAVSAFLPQAGETASAKEVNAALNSLCTATPCGTELVVDLLNDFGSACEAELDPDTGIQTVRTTYDLFYAYTPWRQALCAMDTGSETSCIKEIVAGIEPSAGSDISNATLTGNSTSTDEGTGDKAKDFDIANYAGDALDAKNLYIQTTSGGVTAYVPNSETISSTNMMYMFISPKMPSKMTGIANSALFAGQSDLWDGLSGVCGFRIRQRHPVPLLSVTTSPGSVGKMMIESKNYIMSVALVAAGLLFM